MKEYKLPAKSKYSVLYLLSGLFMFFFMFAILNLSSFASQDGSSAFPYYVIDRYNTDNYIEMFPGGTNYTSLTQNTNVDKYYHLVGRVNVVPDSLTNTDEEFSIVLNTSDGSFNIYSSSATPSMGSTNFSFDIYFKGKYSSLVRYEKEHVGGVGSQYAFYTYTVLIDSCSEIPSSSLGSISSFSDYSNYSFVNTFSIIEDYPGLGYPDYSVSVGSPISLDFPSYNSNNLGFSSGWTYFMNTNKTDYIFMVSFRYPTTTPSFSGLHFYVQNESGGLIYDLTNPSFVFSGGSANAFLFNMIFKFSLDSDNSTLYRFALNGTSDSNFKGISYGLLSRKLTINDYMDYVHDQWDNINPNVTITNQNIAQSQSDISTAQTFETSAFDNFDTQFSNSGLDSFSMSFASTPLLWVSSIITTFYNNMPSTFQYLLMFVAFVGILCTVLNVFGRVAQRFGGGDNATKLNSKDVFSKIEKNGSI